MALIRVYIQPRFPSATDQTAFYDFSGHLEFDSLNWEQNDQGVSSSLQVNHFAILPASSTPWSSYLGATEADKITNALADPFFHLKIYPRTEIQIRDISTSPHTILWGGVITRVEESKDGGAITGSLEAVDYTALLNESVALEYTALGQSTIKQVITSQTYTFSPSFATRTAGEATVTIGSIAIGDPYNRNLQPGDTVVVSLSDTTYNGVSTITSVAPNGANYDIKFTQYSNVADSASKSVTGSIAVPGFMTTNNAPGLDSRIRVQSANISDLNPSYKVSPRNQNITRAVSTVAATTTLATITTSATHGFSKGSKVTVTLTNGPTGYTALNGTYTIKDTPTNSSFTYDLSGSAITSGAATGTAVAEGDMVPMPFKGGTLSDNLASLVKAGTGTFYLNSGTIESGALKIDLFAKPLNQIDAIAATGADPLFATATGWDLGSFTQDTVGNTGPYGVGNTIYYTGTDKQTAELSTTYRVPVSAGENYFVSWRSKATKPNKAHPSIKFYDSGGTVVGNPNGYDVSLNDLPADEWGRNYGIINVPATAVSMTPVLVHDSFSSSHSVWYTDIQMIKITGSFGFSDRPITDTSSWQGINGGSFVFKDFESPSAPTESGESANRIYLYAPYTDEDPITGAKKLTSYRNTYDFVQGVWENGGKRVEASMVSNDATDSNLALLTAQKYFKDKGKALKSYEFEHISGPLNVGDVVPFIWNQLGVAEALVVRRQSGYLIGQQVYYKIQLGGDLAFQRSTMYLLEQRLQEITGDAAYFTPPPSPYPGTATAGGIVTPSVPLVNSGTKQVVVSWQYPQKILSSSSFGGFLLLRGSTSLVGGATTAGTGDGTTATITTTSDHGLSTGDEIVIAGMTPSTYNGGYTVTATPTSRQISFKNTTTEAQTVAGTVNKITSWYKSSTGEIPASAVNPIAPDASVPIYTDSDLIPGSALAYKAAAIDVSGANPVITGYSQISNLAIPTDVSISFDNAYSGLGINVPKLVNSVTYDNVTVTKPISSISRSSGSFIATVNTNGAHGFIAGMPVGIANTSNDAAIKGFYKILSSPSVTTTSFSITTLSDTSLSIIGGSTNGYGDATARTNLSGDYYDNDAVSRTLGDAYSLINFPAGQIAFSEGDGKLYRNGLPGTTAFDGLWVRAAIDAADVSPDGTIRISADRITSGTIDAGIVNVTNLNATNIATGKLTIDNAWGTNAGSATVLYKSKASSVATLWTATEHGFATSDAIYVHLGDTAYDGVKTIAATSVATARQSRLGSVAGVALAQTHNILTGQSITTTGLNADLTGTFTVSAIAATVTNASRVGTVAAVRTSQPHTFTTSDNVTITGVNGNFNVSSISVSGITPVLEYRQQGTPVSGSATSTTATLRTTNPHGFIVGDSVVVAGSGVTAWNATQTVTSTTAPVSDYVRIGTAVTLRTSQYHGVRDGDAIVVSGLGSPYDGTFTVASSNGTSASVIRTQRLLTNGVLTTAGPHGFKVNDLVTVTGTSSTYNLTNTAVTATAVAITSKAQSGTTATLTTTVPHGFLNGDTVVVSGVGSPWDTAGAVISGVATTGNPLTFQYTVGTSATVTTTSATGTANNGKRLVIAVASGTTSIATTTGTATSYSTISYTAGSGTGTVLLTAATGSPTVENGKTFSFGGVTAGTVAPTLVSSGTADSYQTFTYTSPSSGIIASSAITPNGSATTGKTVYFSTSSTSGTIAPANVTGTITNGRIIRYATSAGTDALTSVSSGTVVKKTNIYAISSTNFTVDIDGNIVASGATLTSADVTGAITANSGAIGGWSIGTDIIYSVGTTAYTGLSNGALDSSVSIFAGATDSSGTNAKFYVTNAGTVTASNLIITGGSIGIGTAFGVTSGGQLFAVGGYFDPTTGRPGIVVAGSTTEGDIAAASSGTLNLGYTSAGSSGTGTYKNVVSISSSGLWVYSTSNTIGGAIRSYTSDGATFSEMVWNESNGRIEFSDPIFSASSTFTGQVLASNLTSTGNVVSNGTGFLNDTPTTQTTPTTYTSGRAAIWTNTAGTAYRIDRYVAASSARAKKNIEDTSVAPEQFYGINLVDFEYDHESAKAIWPNLSEMPTSIQHGVIYEQVKEVMPEAVFDENSSGPGDPPGINWGKIYFAALVALQDMNDRVISLEARIAELES